MAIKLSRGGRVRINSFSIDGDSIEFLGNPAGSMDVKFNRVARMGQRYDIIIADLKSIINKESKKPPVSQRYSQAVALLVLANTGIRVGNEDSAEGYVSDLEYSDSYGKTVQTFGLTTIKQEHVRTRKGIVSFDFLGKKQVENTFKLSGELSKLVIPILESNYDPVFKTSEAEFTRFVKKESSPYFSTKDFRTFRANVFAYKIAKTKSKPTTKKEWKETVKECCEYVSGFLNNTYQVVKTSYVDPELWNHIFGNPDELTNKKESKKLGGTLTLKRINNG